MPIVPLPLPPGAEARALLHHLLEHGDIVGKDSGGRTIIQLAADDWVLEKVITFDADAADLEDGGDEEPEADDEEDGAPVLIQLARPKVIARRQAKLNDRPSRHGGSSARTRHWGAFERRVSSHDPRYKPVLPPVPRRPDWRDGWLSVRDQ